MLFQHPSASHVYAFRDFATTIFALHWNDNFVQGENLEDIGFEENPEIEKWVRKSN